MARSPNAGARLNGERPDWRRARFTGGPGAGPSGGVRAPGAGATLAKAFDAEKLDQARLTAVWDWQDQRVAELREDLTAALERLHGALEPEQRRRLVDLLSDDPLRWLVDEV